MNRCCDQLLITNGNEKREHMCYIFVSLLRRREMYVCLNIVVPFSVGDTVQYLHECLKPQIALNPIYTVFFLYKHNFSLRGNTKASLGISELPESLSCPLGILLSKIRATWIQKWYLRVDLITKTDTTVTKGRYSIYNAETLDKQMINTLVGWSDMVSDFITLRMTHNLKFKNCLFLEISI